MRNLRTKTKKQNPQAACNTKLNNNKFNLNIGLKSETD